jgi:hypothetical protein
MVVISSYINRPARLGAEKLGLQRFDPGHPCGYGHDSPRYTNTGICVQCYHKRSRASRALHSKTGLAGHKANIETVRKTREALADEAPKLPQPAANALAHYFESAISQQNSRHLDKLIGIHKKAEPAASQPMQSRDGRRDCQDWRSRTSQRPRKSGANHYNKIGRAG